MQCHDDTTTTHWIEHVNMFPTHDVSVSVSWLLGTTIGCGLPATARDHAASESHTGTIVFFGVVVFELFFFLDVVTVQCGDASDYGESTPSTSSAQCLSKLISINKYGTCNRVQLHTSLCWTHHAGTIIVRSNQ